MEHSNIVPKLQTDQDWRDALKNGFDQLHTLISDLSNKACSYQHLSDVWCRKYNEMKQDNADLIAKIDSLNGMLDDYGHLQTKYDNILAAESGFSSQTENVWQSGYAAGHDAGRESEKGEVWVLGRKYNAEDVIDLHNRCDKMKRALNGIQDFILDAREKQLTQKTIILSIENTIDKALAEHKEGEKEPVPQGPVWVKASDRLLGWAQVAKWRHEGGKELPGMSTISDLTDNGFVTLEGLEWYDDEAAKPAPQQGPAWVTGQYDRLYEQLKAEPERNIVCWVDYTRDIQGKNHTWRDISSIRGKQMDFRARGIGYGGTSYISDDVDEKTEFLQECERLHVQWLDESGKEVKP